METQFAPMKSLGYPSLEIVSQPAKEVNKQLADLRKQLQKGTGFGLAVKSWNHSGPRRKNSRQRTRSAPNADSGAHSEETASRADGWSMSWMGVYGHVVEEQRVYSPSKQAGAPFPGASASDRMLPHATKTCWPPPEQLLSLADQHELLDLFYLHLHTQVPVLRRPVVEAEFEKCRVDDQSSFLSPFFFYSAFAISAQFSSRLRNVGDFCLKQALAYRQAYFGYPCISSIAALIMLSTFLERIKMHPYTHYSWALAGEAFTMVQDLGLHRMCNVSQDPYDQELAGRMFWMAFVCDRFLCVVTGRAFTFDEKDIDVTLPRLTEAEKQDPGAEVCLRNFNGLIDISKVIGRVLRFNFSAQSADFRGPSLHQEAMLSTLDSWIASLMKEVIPHKDVHNMVAVQQLLDTQMILMLHCMLILLHQPYVDDVQTKSGYNRKSSETRPSFEICSASATIITHIAYHLPLHDLEYLANRSDSLYAILIATRLHLMNASFQRDAETTMNGEMNFLRSMAVLEKLAPSPDSSLTATMKAYQESFDSRPDSILSDYAADQIRREACSAEVAAPLYLQFNPALRASAEGTPTTLGSGEIVIELQHAHQHQQPSRPRQSLSPSQTSERTSSAGSTRENGNRTSGTTACRFIQCQPHQAKARREKRPTTLPSAPTPPRSTSSTVSSSDQSVYTPSNVPVTDPRAAAVAATPAATTASITSQPPQGYPTSSSDDMEQQPAGTVFDVLMQDHDTALMAPMYADPVTAPPQAQYNGIAFLPDDMHMEMAMCENITITDTNNVVLPVTTQQQPQWAGDDAVRTYYVLPAGDLGMVGNVFPYQSLQQEALLEQQPLQQQQHQHQQQQQQQPPSFPQQMHQHIVTPAMMSSGFYMNTNANGWIPHPSTDWTTTSAFSA